MQVGPHRVPFPQEFGPAMARVVSGPLPTDGKIEYLAFKKLLDLARRELVVTYGKGVALRLAGAGTYGTGMKGATGTAPPHSTFWKIGESPPIFKGSDSYQRVWEKIRDLGRKRADIIGESGL